MNSWSSHECTYAPNRDCQSPSHNTRLSAIVCVCTYGCVCVCVCVCKGLIIQIPERLIITSSSRHETLPFMSSVVCVECSHVATHYGTGLSTSSNREGGERHACAKTKVSFQTCRGLSKYFSDSLRDIASDSSGPMVDTQGYGLYTWGRLDVMWTERDCYCPGNVSGFHGAGGVSPGPQQTPPAAALSACCGAVKCLCDMALK